MNWHQMPPDGQALAVSDNLAKWKASHLSNEAWAEAIQYAAEDITDFFRIQDEEAWKDNYEGLLETISENEVFERKLREFFAAGGQPHDLF